MSKKFSQDQITHLKAVHLTSLFARRPYPGFQSIGRDFSVGSRAGYGSPVMEQPPYSLGFRCLFRIGLLFGSLACSLFHLVARSVKQYEAFQKEVWVFCHLALKG